MVGTEPGRPPTCSINGALGMRVYLAAVLYNDFREGSQVFLRLDDREKQAVLEVEHILDSYHYVHKPRLVDRIRATGRRIFLDSGAFSAFSQGVEIDIEQYCQYVLENSDFIEVVSVLDAIGDANATFRNQRYIESRGIDVLPCFHYGEPEEALAYYAEHYEYVTLGGMVPISTPQLKIWLDRIWDRYLTDADGRPKLKVHGFGLTSVPLMERYPWFSVDSSSWVQLGGMGNIFLPDFGTLAVSEFAPQRKQAEKHVDNLPREHQEVVLEYIETLGFDIERLRKEHLSRKCFNMVTYPLAGRNTCEAFTHAQPVFF